ncbi:hypothetical protein REPUB_Repub06bG0216300 [Reevesia pubescens]
MPPKFQTSTNPDQMMNQERSYSSSSLDIVELTSSLPPGTQPCRLPSLHQTSASDSLALVNKPYFVGPGSFHSSNIEAEGYLKLYAGDDDGKAIDPNIEKLDDSSSASHGQTEPRKWCRSFDPNITACQQSFSSEIATDI